MSRCDLCRRARTRFLSRPHTFLCTPHKNQPYSTPGHSYREEMSGNILGKIARYNTPPLVSRTHNGLRRRRTSFSMTGTPVGHTFCLLMCSAYTSPPREKTKVCSCSIPEVGVRCMNNFIERTFHKYLKSDSRPDQTFSFQEF